MKQTHALHHPVGQIPFVRSKIEYLYVAVFRIILGHHLIVDLSVPLTQIVQVTRHVLIKDVRIRVSDHVAYRLYVTYTNIPLCVVAWKDTRVIHFQTATSSKL